MNRASTTRARRRMACTILGRGLLALGAPAAWAQGASATGDTLRLDDLHRRAEQVDARAAQSALLVRQSALRRTTIAREARPAPALAATGQYLSDVARVALPGAGPMGPLNHQYDVSATLRAPLLDPTRGARDAVERARLAEQQAALGGALYQQRLQVNDAFFGVLLRAAQRRTVMTLLEDLDARRRILVARRDAGAALPSDVALIDAEIVRRRQALSELAIEDAASRDLLASLTGATVTATTVLRAPVLDTVLPAPARDRPEYRQFARSRDLLAARAAVADAQSRPRLAAVTRTGYGRPGLNALGREFDHWWSAGIQVDWMPFTWGGTQREREEQQVAAAVVATNERQFADALDRTARLERARIDALAAGLPADSAVIALREQVLAEARLRHDAGELPTADFLARLTEAATARLDRDLRLLRITEARARYLTLIGREVR